MNDQIVNPTEKAERIYLEKVRDKIRIALDEAGGTVSTQFSDIMKMKRYIQESKADMDHIEKAAMRQDVDQMTRIGEHQLTQAHRFSKLFETPYFGRIDFRKVQEQTVRPIYIGIHSFHDKETDQHLIHDWRAPVSSMFYDFELGDAYFDAPAGHMQGRLLLKRQYRIKTGVLIFMLETSLNIHDEVLQEELSRASDDRMRNIVATIQRDQNAIIRNEQTHALVIQGAAGSGKTSIALHRMAYLLYKFKDTIISDDILIISPNKVFAHYISQVLPELGEEMIKETTMETLATYLLNYNVKFQSFYEQVTLLLEGQDSDYAERIRFKSTESFLARLEDYVLYVQNTNLEPAEIEGDLYFVSALRIQTYFRQCGAMPYARQIQFVLDAVIKWIHIEFQVEVAGTERTRIRAQIRKMLASTDMKALYKSFYTWLGKPELFKTGKGSVVEYADVFPLIYLTMLLEGEVPHDQVKHLVIDEMQDYTPVQYRVLSRLFRCRKTILGDQHQSVNPLSASTADTIQRIVPQAECMTMNKSYRSTVEITALAQQINRNDELIPIERHGETPERVLCIDDHDETALMRKRIQAFHKSAEHTTLGIICKTQRQVDDLYRHLRNIKGGVIRLDASSALFSQGVILTTAHLAKGLEFDQVIVPFCHADNYHRLIDRHMLYVACTRAMHTLTLTYTGTLTPFLSAGGDTHQ